MDANLDLLLTVVYCIVDDFLPERPGNARRKLTDAEIITISIAQSIMGIPSDYRFLALARRQIGHLFPRLPERTAYHKRRLRLSRQIEALISKLARRSAGYMGHAAGRLHPGAVRPVAGDGQARRALQPD